MGIRLHCRVFAAVVIIFGLAGVANADDREFQDSVTRILEKMTKRHDLSEAEIRTLKQQMAGVQKDVGDLKNRLSSLERRNTPGSIAMTPDPEGLLNGGGAKVAPMQYRADPGLRTRPGQGSTAIRSGAIVIGPSGISIGGRLVIQSGWDDDD